MNHNKHNLQIGQMVMLDEGYATSSKVIIDRFTPNQMYATVTGADDSGDFVYSSWQVMTNRLTPLLK